MVSANFFILIAKVPLIVEKIQSEVAHHDSILIRDRDQALLARWTGKVQVSQDHNILNQLSPIASKKVDRYGQVAISSRRSDHAHPQPFAN